MAIVYILDRIIQYLLVEVLEAFITKASNFLTKLVCCFWKKKSETNKQFLSHIDILYQSGNFLVLDKPPDLLINSDDTSKNTVQTILREQLPELINPNLKHEFYFAHRLDFSTSGILCIPLHKLACASLSKSFEKRLCEKYYVAVVNGHVQHTICDVNLAIGEDIRYEKTSKRMCTVRQGKFCKRPRKSQTRFVLLAHGMYNKLPISKVLLQPITGRRHQLRLHCSAIGHPILGDYTYGSEEDKNMPRMYLHAIRLSAPNESENIYVETQDPFTEPSFQFCNEVLPLAGIKTLKNKNI